MYTLGYVINYDYDTINSQLHEQLSIQCQQTLNIDSKYMYSMKKTYNQRSTTMKLCEQLKNHKYAQTYM